ncbi:hypothetical protein EVAR_8920_1 [Eumeta japonica]|uniref:Uncharacterized protein n=1 Tax=Eumeta variegata TaxID=151549 RepID=A0A4C1U0J9_EUMVA|nr:hypothetical protein EVAR_8920_1 [Eumeta japonica]
MPIFTPWSIKPYSPGIGPLLNFGEVFLFCNIDRRFSHRSIFEDIQKYNENNRHVNENYKPLYDIAIQCREILDYDEYIISFYSHIGDVGRKQLQPLIYLENKELSYRLPERGKDHRSFSKEQIHKMRKQGKKHELYQPMIMKPETTKFPIPDFALSDDQLLMRKTGSLYEKIKSDPDKLYDNFAKESPHISAANLVNAEIHQSVKTVYKTYSTGGKKVLNTEIRKRSVSIDRESIPSKSYYNNGRSASDNLNVIEKHEERNKAVSALPHLDRNNMIVMEPLLLMQTLNEDRQKRRQELSIKHQKIIIRVMLTYCTIVYTFALIVFYFYSLS